MSRINHVIQPRAFEFIRDRIGSILADELNEQFTTYNVQEAKALVTIEGDKVVDGTEMSTVLVALSKTPLDNEHAGEARGKHTFNIDCFSRAKTTDAVDGAVLASFKAQRLVGLCYAILKDAAYDTLGYTPGFIGNVSIPNIGVGDPSEKDMLCTIMARMTVVVTANETTELFTPSLIAGYQTTILVGGSTIAGYQYNPPVIM